MNQRKCETKSYQINTFTEKGNPWAKFKFNHAIGPKEEIHYKNIDDAKGAPLIQQLFYLPFVKSVRLLENKIEVERQQHELLQYLRKAVNNFSITLKITVNETLEKKYAYTPKDKYEKLVEKNKNIELLRKTFDLDL